MERPLLTCANKDGARNCVAPAVRSRGARFSIPSRAERGCGAWSSQCNGSCMGAPILLHCDEHMGGHFAYCGSDVGVKRFEWTVWSHVQPGPCNEPEVMPTGGGQGEGRNVFPVIPAGANDLQHIHCTVICTVICSGKVACESGCYCDFESSESDSQGRWMHKDSEESFLSSWNCHFKLQWT